MKTFAVGVALLLTETFSEQVNPVGSVLQLLDNLRHQVAEQGDTEAQTYNEFACMCRNETEVKTSLIAENEARYQVLDGTVKTRSSDRDNLENQIATTKDQISALDAATSQLEREREAARTLNLKEEADVEAGITALAGAITALETHKDVTSSLLQSPSIRRALLLASTMEEVSVERKAMFMQLQDPPAPTVQAYQFKSDNVIEMLRGLEKDFQARHTALQQKHAADDAMYSQGLVDMTNTAETLKTNLQLAESGAHSARDDIAAAEHDLTVLYGSLQSDKAFLVELAARCQEKANLFNQRSQSRASELQAVTMAKQIIQQRLTRVAGDNQQSSPSLMSLSSRLRSMAAIRRHRNPQMLLNWKRVVAHRLPASKKASLLSIAPETSKALQSAIHSLEKSASSLSSPLLGLVLVRAREDPFVKVRSMIENMIAKLQSQAHQEANFKGLCDTQTAEAQSDIDGSMESVQESSRSILTLGKRSDELNEQIRSNEQKIADLEAQLSQATSLRQQSANENSVAIEDAQNGVAALNDAVNVLRDYYGEAVNAVTPTQTEAHVTSGDAGFDTAYSGSRSFAGSIFSMLEVISADLQTSIESTTEKEKSEQHQFTELSNDINANIAASTTAIENDSAALADVNNQLATERQNLQNSVKVASNAFALMSSIRTQCDGYPEENEYETAKAKREAEIDALRIAGCHLDPTLFGDCHSLITGTL